MDLFNMSFSQVKIKIIRGHDDSINSAEFFAQDSRILTSSNDGTVRMWQCNDGKELVKFTDLHAPGMCISKSSLSYDSNR